MPLRARRSFIQSLAVVAAVAILWANTPHAAAAMSAPGVADPRYDLTGNQLITSADAAAMTNAWTLAQEQNQCAVDGFAQADVTGDGCLDVADVQAVAAQMGNATNLQAPQLHVAATDVNAIPSITLTVNAASSEDDANPGDGVCATALGTCTLRAALQEANSRPGPERIEFAIPSTNCATVTIRPVRYALNFFTLEDQTGGITIDGYSQCGAKVNTAATAGNAVLRVEVDGSFLDAKGKAQNAALGVDGITIMSPNNVVRGLALLRWDHAVMIMNKEAQFNHIEGNFIGSNAAQTFDKGYGMTAHYEGLRFRLDAANNVLGCGTFPGGVYTPCTDPATVYADRNVVAGNGNDGIHLQGDGDSGQGSPHDNHIVGTIVGLKQNGATVLANHGDGVDFEQGVHDNWLGGNTALERNILTANASEGIEISHSIHTQHNVVANNYFGLDITGTKGILNVGNGISFEDTVDQNYVYGNVVGGNYGNGIRFYVGATRNEVHDNLVGVAADGVTPMPNGVDPNNPYGQDGVFVMGGSQHNLISHNLIAHSPSYGVEVDPISDQVHGWAGPTWFNTISQNTIFDSGVAGIKLKSKSNQTTGILYYGNQNIAKPSISVAGTNYVVGKTCANCTVEVFKADPNSTLAGAAVAHTSGDGRTYIASALSGADGQFNVPVTGVVMGDFVTADTTDDQGNTSQFATNKTVQSGPVATLTPGPTLTPTPGQEATATVIAATETAAANSAATQIAQATAQAAATEAAAETATPVALTAEAATAQAPTAAAATATAAISTAASATANAQAATATSQAATDAPASTAQAATATAQAATATAQAATAPAFRVLLPMIVR